MLHSLVLPNPLLLRSLSLETEEVVIEQPLSPLEQAWQLLTRYTPANTELIIEELNTQLFKGYVFRLKYTSGKSGRTICTVAKGTALPEADDHLLHFYLRQLILSPSELGREFSRTYFYERRARQDAFLMGGENGRQNVLVTNDTSDRLGYEDYA